MRLTRIYTPGPLKQDGEVALTPSGGNHVARVLRLRAGDVIAVFDGEGNEFSATIAGVKGARVGVRIGEPIANSTEPPLQLELLQAISRGDRMDWVVQKATELGVSIVRPLLAARSVVKLDRDQAAKKQEHWRQIAIGACEQSGRARLPEIALPESLLQHLASNRTGNGDSPHFCGLVLDPLAPQSLNAIERNGDSPHFKLLIGPEGGLDEKELAAASEAGFVAVRLGPRILRTETAAVAALAVLQAKWGDLR